MKCRFQLALYLVTGVAVAQSGGPFEVTGAAAVGGGGEMAGGAYRAAVTAGQPGAAVQPSSGGQWSMDSGLWPAQTAGSGGADPLIFANGFED